MSNEKIFPIISEQIYTDDVLGFFRANYNEIDDKGTVPEVFKSLMFD